MTMLSMDKIIMFGGAVISGSLYGNMCGRGKMSSTAAHVFLVLMTVLWTAGALL